MPITVTKELLINLGNFSNIKIIASITSDTEPFEDIWKQLNKEILEQEEFEKRIRIAPKLPKESDWKPAKDLPF